jgi:uncharacterized protein YjcR
MTSTAPFQPPATATAIIPPEVTPIAPRRRARSLYWQGWAVEQIAEELDLPRTTISSWKAREKWDDASSVQRMNDHLECRLGLLIAKDKKTSHDFKEIDLLFREMERMARIEKFRRGGNEVDINPKVANRNAPEVLDKKSKKKNLIDRDGLEKLKEVFHAENLAFQEGWWKARKHRQRFIIKSRQIGATWYFAREALIHALETGNNQIFISASRSQALIFRRYISSFVLQVLGMSLQGNPLVIQRGEDEDGNQLPEVEFHFLGTNYRTAQGYTGDVYIDEAFWIYGFEDLEKVAKAMATHKQYHRTYFSTPSVKAHEAYALWSGERFNARRAKTERAKFDISHKALKAGAVGRDRVWRQIVNIDDAIEGGAAKFVDRAELVFENSVDEFELLFLCQFLDDTQSVFPFELMSRCGVDPFSAWKDFREFDRRPFGDGEVWVGYDPNGESGTGDDAGLIIAAPPAKPTGAFRVLEKHRFRGKDYQQQSAAIRAITKRYNVVHIAIDTTGIGQAVFSLVSAWFPSVRAIRYTPEVKAMMVYKAKKVISDGRLKYAAHWHDLTNSFMAIRPKVTKGGKAVTYVAGRSDGTGHADLAWATMHVLFNEALDPEQEQRASTMELF